MVVNGAEKLYREYLGLVDSRWEYANSVLYRMCQENPTHDDEHVVVGKIWLIGRSYAAAIERRKNASDSNDDFYYDKFLMDAFYNLTGLEKRSLASKYLHFHCPEKFFIYDSRARAAIGKLVKRPDKKILVDIGCDSEYGDFVCRMLELQEYLVDKVGVYEMPRKLDSFLLTAVKG